MFKPNIDNSGRILRLVIAIILLIYAIGYGSWLALLASAFVFFEALRGWCVFYQLMGKNSCPIDPNHRD
ncbi:MAG: DUF2892 domain-containing protein, partial [Parachlamydiaceae bacterium]|nr:DUF2892 domain-containing protein [Parachlamydiaceae bacterium]